MNQQVHLLAPAGARRRLNRSALLAAAAPFRGLTPSALQRIAQSARAVRVARGETLPDTGKDARTLCILGAGTVALSVHAAPDRERVFAVMGPGETFGVEYMYAQPRVAVSARMLTEGVVVRVPFDALLDTLAQFPSLARALMGDLSRRALDVVRQIESQTMQCARERVAGFLLHLGSGRDGAPEDVTLPAPKRIVASLLDLTKESFSRVLHELAENRLIEVRRRTIHLLSPGALAQICSKARGCADCAYCPRGGAWT